MSQLLWFKQELAKELGYSGVQEYERSVYRVFARQIDKEKEKAK